jgi:hypothetical protein
MGDQEAPEVAFYYPGHLWGDTDWVKTLLLFFDGIGLLVPEYKRQEPELFDPVLAGPLREQGLLHYLVADEAVDKTATERLSAALLELIRAGVLDDLAKDGSAFHAISRSRMGYYGDRQLAEAMFEELSVRNLARPSEDGVSIPMHRNVRYLILVLLAQILRPRGKSMGLELSPVTDRAQIVRALQEFLDLPMVPSTGHVITFDLQTVSVDLSSVPLDEVLDFRREHLRQHRAYVRSVRKFARELSLMSGNEREPALRDRQVELNDLASDIRRTATISWRLPASFALGLASATWSYVTGDRVAALFAAGSAVVGALSPSTTEAGAFSYLFDAKKRYA